jgi:hypothetical protein
MRFQVFTGAFEILAMPGPQCAIMMVDDVAAFVVKLDRETIDEFRGKMSIAAHTELGQYPQGAVIRLVAQLFHDASHGPFEMDMFLNPANRNVLRVLRRLCGQDVLNFHFFDMAIDYVLSKGIPYQQGQRDELDYALSLSLRHNRTVRCIDFAAVKAAMMRDHPL